MEFYAVILAGGIGTRFWPLSRKERPKQFLPIISDKTMIEETVERLAPLIRPDRIYTIANSEQSRSIRNIFPGIPGANFLVEPQGRNTAPSLILATAHVYLQNPGAVVAALPADHLITDVPLFLKKLEAGALAADKRGVIVTFGIPPTFPSTGYGYIQFSPEASRKIRAENFYSVLEFKEKPNVTQAKAFLEAGNHFWNSGIFLWKAGTLARKLQKYAPDWYVYWEKILQALQAKNAAEVAAIFEEIPSTSIDYALMEKARGVLMCEGNFGWSDVGAWSSLFDIWPKDPEGNALRAESMLLDSENCLVYSRDKLTALVGVKDLIVVDTPDALLICRKDQDQKVKDIVGRLKKDNKDEYL
ncbi:MAG: mannose-1-phosphate guanylyltransferase [Candidatus Aminicenantes bacterium]|jgi:mannose-1-phosphate guanylyltransferase